jgi:hypothetical protein
MARQRSTPAAGMPGGARMKPGGSRIRRIGDMSVSDKRLPDFATLKEWTLEIAPKVCVQMVNNREGHAPYEQRSLIAPLSWLL